jgi:spore germination protein AB
MDKGQIRKLNAYHVIFLVSITIIGVKLLTLPHDMSVAGYNQWWIPILLGFIAQMTMLPMILLCRRYPEDTVLAINEKLLGKWLAKPVNLVLVIYAILSLSTVCEGYIRLVHVSSLPNQTITFPLIGLFVVMIYITLGGIKSIARFCILAFFFTTWMIYYLQWGWRKGELGHMLPLFNLSFSQTVQVVHDSYPAMFGYELILFWYPYVIHREKVYTHATVGIWLVIFYYVLVSGISVMYFSEWQLANVAYPVLKLFKAVELTFLERIETLGIGLWVFLILSTGAPYLWAAKKGWDSIMGKRRLIHLYLSAGIAFFLIRGEAVGPYQKFFKETLLYLNYVVILWPIVLLLIHWIRSKLGGARS